MAEGLLTFELPPFGGSLSGRRGFTPGRLVVAPFASGELHARLGTEVEGRDCILVGPIGPSADPLAPFLLAAHTLAKARARSVKAVVPYCAYAREDREHAGQSLAAEWVGRLLAAAGVDRLVTVDLHSEEARALSAVPIESISPAPLFACALRPMRGEDFVVVAPDEGALARAGEVAAAMEAERPVVVFHKRRTSGGIVHLGYDGGLARHAVIADDILDTGATLVSCCVQLRAAGVERITIVVTHGLFTRHAWRHLWDAGVERLYTTDSVRVGAAPPGVRVLSIWRLLARRLRAGDPLAGARYVEMARGAASRPALP